MEIEKNVDLLQLYRGNDYAINDQLVIHQPSLNEICDYGEKKYFNMVHTLCSVGADLKWQLDDVGIDYTTVSDYDLFCSILSREFTKEQTKILFGDVIDFSKMIYCFNKKIEEKVLVQIVNNDVYLQIDRFVYSSIVNVLRYMHRMKRNDELPGNEATKRILIEDAREEYELNKSKPQKSYLLPLISTMVNSEGFKRDDQSVFDMKIYAFLDSVGRIGKIKNAGLLLSSGYSGFGIDLKKIAKEELNWLGDLD